MNRKCEEIKGLILELGDPSLEQDKRRVVQEHLAQCASCGKLETELKGTWELLDHFPGIEPSRSFVSNAVKNARDHDRSLRSSAIYKMVAAVAAAIILALCFLYYPDADQGLTDQNDLGQVTPELIENIELIEDLEFLEEFGEDLELAMEADIYDLLADGGRP